MGGEQNLIGIEYSALAPASEGRGQLNRTTGSCWRDCAAVARFRAGPKPARVPRHIPAPRTNHGWLRTGSGDFFKIHYSAITTQPPEANSLITNERQ